MKEFTEYTNTSRLPKLLSVAQSSNLELYAKLLAFLDELENGDFHDI